MASMGSLYRKISALGYKLVAHYLIQTRKENTESGDNLRKVPTSAKQSLPFVETKTSSTDMKFLEYNYNPQELDMGLKPDIVFEAPKEDGGSPEVIGPIDSSVEKEPHNCDVMKTSEEADFPESEMRKSISMSSFIANTNLEPCSVNHMLSMIQERGRFPDFVLCIDDDRSDEDMSEVITSFVLGPSMASSTKVFACTVGRKPSKAKYYLDDTVEIFRLMQGIRFYL